MGRVVEEGGGGEWGERVEERKQEEGDSEDSGTDSAGMSSGGKLRGLSGQVLSLWSGRLHIEHFLFIGMEME